MAQAALLADSLFSRIIDSYNKDEIPEFLLVRYKQDADKVMKQNRYCGEFLMGLIEGLRHNRIGVINHYHAAIKLCDIFEAHHNFVHAFISAYDYESGKNAVVASIRTINLSDPEEVDGAATNAFLYGMIEDAIRLQKTLKKLQGRYFNEQFLNALEKLKELNVQNLPTVLMQVYNELARYRIITYAARLNMHMLYGDVHMEYVFTVNENDVERVAECQDSINQALAQYELDHDLEPLPIWFRLIRRALS